MDWIVGLIASCLWGYLAGYALAAVIEWVQLNARPIRVPFATSIMDGLARGLRWYIRMIQEIVNGLSAAIEGALRSMSRQRRRSA